MEYLIELLKFFGTAIGVIIGWALTRKNDSEKIKYSEIRKIKRSLFVLLEIRHQIALDKYLNILSEELILKISENTDEKIEPVELKGFITQIKSVIINENFKTNLKAQFDKCIDDLSEIDPVLTFRINGKQHVQDYFNTIENMTKSYYQTESVEDIKRTINSFNSKLFDEIRNEIESIIIYLAELIGKKEVGRVKEIISEPEDLSSKIDIDRYVETIIS